MDLAGRHLPDIFLARDGSKIENAAQWEENRPALLDLIAKYEYGILPDAAVRCSYEEVYANKNTFHAGHSTLQGIEVTAQNSVGQHKWTFYLALPKASKKVPVLLHIEFDPHYPVHTVPVENICSRGYGYATFQYTDVTSDNNDFTDGVARLFYPNGQRGEHDGGKIALWAWAMSRVLDCLERDPRINSHEVIAVGHSRLGKTALWASACDTRFFGAVPNGSGCAGAALFRGNTGEQNYDISLHFPYWFAPAFAGFDADVTTLPFDQHQTIALTAPRHMFVMSGSKDNWADPASEYLGCVAASDVWALYGKKGIEVLTEEEIGENRILSSGDIGYQRREGTHFLGCTDYTRLMDFFDTKRS